MTDSSDRNKAAAPDLRTIQDTRVTTRIVRTSVCRRLRLTSQVCCVECASSGIMRSGIWCMSWECRWSVARSEREGVPGAFVADFSVVDEGTKEARGRGEGSNAVAKEQLEAPKPWRDRRGRL